MPYRQQDFAKENGVTSAIVADFAAWHTILTRWNAKINLVSQTALEDYWFRHALDSWQLAAHIPAETKSIIDLGSGGGFPGLALAIHFKHRGGAESAGHVTLVESVGKKANFLRTVIRQLSLPADVKDERAEDIEPAPFDVISARAFAPLPRLLDYAAPFWAEHSKAVLLKGQNIQTEIKDAQEKWTFETKLTESKSDPEGSVMILSNLLPKH